MENFSKTGLSILSEMYEMDKEDGYNTGNFKEYMKEFYEISENEIMRKHKMTIDAYISLNEKAMGFLHEFIYNNGARGCIVAKNGLLEKLLKESEENE